MIDYEENFDDWLEYQETHIFQDVHFKSAGNYWFGFTRYTEYVDGVLTENTKGHAGYTPELYANVSMNNRWTSQPVQTFHPFGQPLPLSGTEYWYLPPYKMLELHYHIFNEACIGNTIIGGLDGEENKNIDIYKRSMLASPSQNTIDESPYFIEDGLIKETTMNDSYPKEDYINLPPMIHSMAVRKRTKPKKKTIIIPFTTGDENGIRVKLGFISDMFDVYGFTEYRLKKMSVFDGTTRTEKTINEGYFWIIRLHNIYYFVSYDTSTETTSTTEIDYNEDTFKINIQPNVVDDRMSVAGMELKV